MSRRRSARLRTAVDSGDDRGAHFDERLGFLRDVEAGQDEFPIRAQFEHRIEGATGPVEVVYWPSRSKQGEAPEQLTLFILGNPGLINYYLPFLSHLNTLLPESHGIICTSHIGHEPHLPAPSGPAELEVLLETKIELVSALRTSLDAWTTGAERSRPKLVLMGHSLGGWLVCEVMKRLNSEEPETIHAGHLLFPSLGWMAESWNGRTMWPLFTPLVINTLPTVSYLLRPILPLTTFPSSTLALLRSPKSIYHVLQLARSELRGILAPDLDWIQSQTLGPETSGLHGVWSAGKLDGWVGKDGPLVQDRLGGLQGGRVRTLEKVPHAFCLSKDHSVLVAEIVASWMDHSIQSQPKDSAEPTNASISSVAPM